jgi:tagaturonate reductase
MSKTDEIGIIQFGEGNFLRCFVDWMIHRMNKSGIYPKKVALVQPIPQGRIEELAGQSGRYHCILQGIREGKSASEIEEIDVFRAFINPYDDFEGYMKLAANPSLEIIVSNTTESGIGLSHDDRPDDTPPAGFPAKLTLLLKKRFESYPEKDLHIIPCELIDNNGAKLKQCILSCIASWKLDKSFGSWIERKVNFYNTLVDRIVPGFPKNPIDERVRAISESDQLATVGEYYHQWVIENGERLEAVFPLKKAGFNVIYPDKLKSYRDRKVRILNGAHTAMVSVGLSLGIKTVGDFLADRFLRRFLVSMLQEEVAPTIRQDRDQVLSFIDKIIERFENPFIEHRLVDISLNSISKFKTRLFPSLMDYVEMNGQVPERIAFCLRSLMNSIQHNGNPLAFKDDPDLISLVKTQNFESLLHSDKLWGDSSEFLKSKSKEILEKSERAYAFQFAREVQ